MTLALDLSDFPQVGKYNCLFDLSQLVLFLQLWQQAIAKTWTLTDIDKAGGLRIRTDSHGHE